MNKTYRCSNQIVTAPDQSLFVAYSQGTHSYPFFCFSFLPGQLVKGGLYPKEKITASMITKCMLRVGSSMTSVSEANLASGGSEFSDSSSSVSIDDLPPTFGCNQSSGLLAVVTTPATPSTTPPRSRLLHISGGSTGDSLFVNDSTMMTLMEASDCDEFTGMTLFFMSLTLFLSCFSGHFWSAFLVLLLLAVKWSWRTTKLDLKCPEQGLEK